MSKCFPQEEIDVRKDTERADEIRALKKAWEDAEPGRAAKALQSRLAYLKSHMVATQHASVVDDHGTIAEEESVTDEKSADPADGATSPGPYMEAEEGMLSLEPPPPPPPSEVLQPLDISPFLRSVNDASLQCTLDISESLLCKELTTDSPYLTLMGEIWCVLWEFQVWSMPSPFLYCMWYHGTVGWYTVKSLM